MDSYVKCQESYPTTTTSAASAGSWSSSQVRPIRAGTRVSATVDGVTSPARLVVNSPVPVQKLIRFSKVNAIRLWTAMAIAVCATGCGSAATTGQPPVIRPGAPGADSRVLSPAEAKTQSVPQATGADI